MSAANGNNLDTIVRLAYPSETASLRQGDTIVVRSRNGERKIPAGKWWVNRNTPVGEDAELWEEKPWNGRRYIDWSDVVAVERPDENRRMVRRLSDGKVLPLVGEQGDEICVEELFDYADGGPSPRPLKLWHPKSRYESVNAAVTGRNAMNEWPRV